MLELASIDSGSLSGVFWLHLEWDDPNLAWDTDQDYRLVCGILYRGVIQTCIPQVNKIVLHSSDIWVPDIELYNAMKTEAMLAQDMVVVSANGRVIWVPSYRLTAACKMDYTWYPFDEQWCDLKFGSWVYNGWMLNISLVTNTIKTILRGIMEKV